MSSLFQLFVFLLPTQLGYHFWPQWAYVFGIRVDYLAPTVFLTDLLLLSFVFLSLPKLLKENRKSIKPLVLGIVFLSGLAAANTLFSSSVPISLMRWVKILELFLLVLLTARLKEFDFRKWVVKPLAFSLILFSLIGLAQVFLGGTVGGPLYFLGERSFSLNTPGISTVNIFGKEILKAYSTFSHPNSLAGFLGVALLVVTLFYPKEERGLIKPLAIFLGAVCFLATFSAAAALSLMVLFGVYRVRKKRFFKGFVLALFWLVIVLSLMLPLVSGKAAALTGDKESITRRFNLAETAGKMISQKPWLGVGANNFVVELPSQSLYPAVSWWLQPVHNIYLLAFSETGILGLLSLVYLLFLGLNRNITLNKQLLYPLLFIVLTGAADHYWLTLQQNQLLFALVLGLSFRKPKV